ncbi:thiamine-phosphate kinase [Brackiella oedipodis]|uniref:thiamine-phosphate kinase n=1 Tax=Brackiella oedipodis TaxID=124225 RepID=UPI00048FF545|nr:thiamine-phosphate kinase [Brackiella oedipodis]
MGEFDLIKQYFTSQAPQQDLGPGDDCALIHVGTERLAVTKDLLLEGRHFFADVDPYRLGHKALAVNLSDLAAMSAQPTACFLGLAIAQAQPRWLQAFSQGFMDLARQFNCPLQGGDTCASQQGVIISVTCMGTLPLTVTAPLRSGAQVGDDIWLSGQLGGAHLALTLLQKAQQAPLSDRDKQTLQACRDALELPQPQVALGLQLRNIAHAMIDISDGLLQDLNHILQASHVGARLFEAKLPVIPELQTAETAFRRQAVFNGGDVYQLCFTAAAHDRPKLEALAQANQLHLSRIGSIMTSSGIELIDQHGQAFELAVSGFNHFK